MSIQVRPSLLDLSRSRSSEPFDSTDAAAKPASQEPVAVDTFGVANSGPSARLLALDAAARFSVLSAGSDTASDSPSVVFEKRFAALAEDPKAFHALMREVYRDSFSKQDAETLRVRAQNGDFSWLPDVKFVGANVLGYANGAFDADSNTIYITEGLEGTPLASETFIEEAGHALDIKLNGTQDTAGDEGETLSVEDKASIRAEDDTGTIVVDGETRSVEFWGNPFKKIGNWVNDKIIKPVGRAIDDHIIQPLKDNVLKPLIESPFGQKVVSWGMDKLHSFGIWIDKLSGAPEERGLSTQEIDYLKPIYGDSIDYSAIRIQQGGIKDLLGMRANTVRHDIFMDDSHTDRNMYDASGNLTQAGRKWLDTLGHEAMHVWQYEQQGTAYIGGALTAQWFGDGYNLQAAFDEGKSFEDMNPEQQGMMAQAIGTAMSKHPVGLLTEAGFTAASGITLEPGQYDIVLSSHATLLAG